MKHFIALGWSVAMLLGISCTPSEETTTRLRPTEYVNPLMGTDTAE